MRTRFQIQKNFSVIGTQILIKLKKCGRQISLVGIKNKDI